MQIQFPHSKLIDKILAIKDPNLNINYGHTYQYHYYEPNNPTLFIASIIPLFSFNNCLFYITEHKTHLMFNDTIIKYVYDANNLKLIPEETNITFKDIFFHPETFEFELLDAISGNMPLIRYFITKEIKYV